MPSGGMPGGGMPSGAMPGGAAPGGGTGGAPPTGGATPPGGAAPTTGGSGAMPGMPGAGGTGAASSANLASGRYVDLSYASILDINRLRNAMKGLATNPQDMLLSVAKRMPVRMQFRMDQKKLPKLLAECGNSKLPVEVRQVRINRSEANSSSSGTPSSGMSGGMPGSASAGSGAGMSMPGSASSGSSPGLGGGGFPGLPGSGGGGQNNSKPASIASSKTDPNEITVEIYGIVYIYNPPDRKLLGIPEPAGSAVPGPVPTPTSTTPPAAPPISAGAATGR